MAAEDMFRITLTRREIGLILASIDEVINMRPKMPIEDDLKSIDAHIHRQLTTENMAKALDHYALFGLDKS